MTEGEKRCGFGSFFPMSCRGRAEAFARRLHNRLRSLGSQDGTSETSWLTNNEVSTSVTNIQPRHTQDSEIFMDFGLFDTPGSPEEEIIEPEITKFINNPKDELHNLNLDECACVASNGCHKRNSLDSDSSDGAYFDPENTEIESNCIGNHLNGVSNSESRTEEKVSLLQDEELLPSDCATVSECTPSSLSRNVSEDDECLRKTSLDETDHVALGWCLDFQPHLSNKNNNVYSAIDLESLKQNGSIISSQEEISSNEDDCSIISNESKGESYCSHLNIQHNLTVECPNVTKPVVEVSTLEIIDTDEKEGSPVKLELNGTNDTNSLQVKDLIDGNHEDAEIEERIPRVRRCSSLKTGKTPPGTPGRKKIVRFADVLGLDLADVRTFMDEIPKVPISAYDDLSVSLSDTSLSSHSFDTQHTCSKTVVPLFQQPGGEANFMEKIKTNLVCLENAILKDAITFSICGTVRVRNLDFHKSVHIRYSIDQWKSYSDLQATYMEGSCDGFSDKFSFTLYVHTLTIGQRLEFAIRFQCKGCQYWDNNGGQNYVFQCLPPSTNTSYAIMPASEDSTWVSSAFY